MDSHHLINFVSFVRLLWYVKKNWVIKLTQITLHPQKQTYDTFFQTETTNKKIAVNNINGMIREIKIVDQFKDQKLQTLIYLAVYVKEWRNNKIKTGINLVHLIHDIVNRICEKYVTCNM